MLAVGAVTTQGVWTLRRCFGRLVGTLDASLARMDGLMALWTLRRQRWTACCCQWTACWRPGTLCRRFGRLVGEWERLVGAVGRLVGGQERFVGARGRKNSGTRTTLPNRIRMIVARMGSRKLFSVIRKSSSPKPRRESVHRSASA